MLPKIGGNTSEVSVPCARQTKKCTLTTIVRGQQRSPIRNPFHLCIDAENNVKCDSIYYLHTGGAYTLALDVIAVELGGTASNNLPTSLDVVDLPIGPGKSHIHFPSLTCNED